MTHNTSLQSLLTRADELWLLCCALLQVGLHRGLYAETRIHPRVRRAFYHGDNGAVGVAARSSLTVRDAIAWASFCATTVSAGVLSVWEAYAHGAYLTLLDGLGLGLGIPEATAQQLRSACEAFLRGQLPPRDLGALASAAFHVTPPELGANDGADDIDASTFGAGPFRVTKVRLVRAPNQSRQSSQSAASGAKRIAR